MGWSRISSSPILLILFYFFNLKKLFILFYFHFAPPSPSLITRNKCPAPPYLYSPWKESVHFLSLLLFHVVCGHLSKKTPTRAPQLPLHPHPEPQNSHRTPGTVSSPKPPQHDTSPRVSGLTFSQLQHQLPLGNRCLQQFFPSPPAPSLARIPRVQHLARWTIARTAPPRRAQGPPWFHGTPKPE